jgi:MFS family permease
LYGRRNIYLVCNLLFLAFTTIGGESRGLSMLVTFRFFAGCAGSAPLTIGGGSIADLMVPEQRGAAVVIFSLGPLIGPIVGMHELKSFNQ